MPASGNLPMKDIFGEALYSYWKGDRKTPYIIRRDDGYVDEGSLEIYFTELMYPTEQVVAGYIGEKILDVGCGAGRYLLSFQERGFDIFGIDISPLAIKVCKKRGAKNAFILDAFQPTFPPGSFDTILLFGNNIGIGGNLPGAKYLLRAQRQLIKPGGHLLLDSLDVTRTNKKTHLQYHLKNRLAGRYVGEIKIRVEYRGETGDWFKWLHIAPADLQDLATETGWTIKEVFAHPNGEYSAVLTPV